MGLPMDVKPLTPVTTVQFALLAQWIISRLPLSSRPPTMPTCISPG